MQIALGELSRMSCTPRLRGRGQQQAPATARDHAQRGQHEELCHNVSLKMLEKRSAPSSLRGASTGNKLTCPPQGGCGKVELTLFLIVCGGRDARLGWHLESQLQALRGEHFARGRIFPRATVGDENSRQYQCQGCLRSPRTPEAWWAGVGSSQWPRSARTQAFVTAEHTRRGN